MPTTRNVMKAVLLAPGPVSTRQTTRNMSSSFKVAVTKPKFLAAASQLHKCNLGQLIETFGYGSGSRPLPVFIKKPPVEMVAMLKMKEFSDLCTSDEYEHRFKLPTPASIKLTLQAELISKGLVLPQDFQLTDSKGVNMSLV